MKKIALVTDSTADLTPELIAECEAHVIPLKVSFGDEHFIAHELSSEEFYQRLKSTKILPTTSQPAPEDFIALYKRLLEKYEEVVSIHLSSALSGTLNAAHIAQTAFKDRIHLVDSKSISLGLGMMVTEAARSISEGLSAQAILEKVNDLRKRSETIFTLDTLEYLQKGGRIGLVSGMVGSLLNIKPIIRVNEEGIYAPAGKARSQDKALASIMNTFQELSKGRKAVQLGIAHGDAPEAAQRLQEGLEKLFSIKANILNQVGPVIGVHTGPGTVGAAIEFA